MKKLINQVEVLITVCEDRISILNEKLNENFTDEWIKGDHQDQIGHFQSILDDAKKTLEEVNGGTENGVVKSYIEPILQEIVEAGYLYAVTYDGEEFSTEATDDVSKGFGKDEYKGVHAYDDSYILVLNKDESVLPHVKEGWIRWTNCNDGIEKVIDYTTNLDEKIGFDSLTEKWEKDYDKFIKEVS